MKEALHQAAQWETEEWVFVWLGLVVLHFVPLALAGSVLTTTVGGGQALGLWAGVLTYLIRRVVRRFWA